MATHFGAVRLVEPLVDPVWYVYILRVSVYIIYIRIYIYT